MAGFDDPAISWRKASACSIGDCVEIASLGDQVLLRGTQTPSTVLAVNRSEWTIFAAAVRNGEFEDVGRSPNS